MKICILLILSLAGVSCTNTAFLAHTRAYDANVSLSADLTKVLAMNVGYEGQSFVASPPQTPLAPNQLYRPSATASGDALSTASSLKVQRVRIKDSNQPSNDGILALDFVASTATGRAATAVAEDYKKTKDAKKAAEDKKKAETKTEPAAGQVAKPIEAINAAEKISKDPSSIKSYELIQGTQKIAVPPNQSSPGG